eukprot:111043_1
MKRKIWNANYLECELFGMCLWLRRRLHRHILDGTSIPKPTRRTRHSIINDTFQRETDAAKMPIPTQYKSKNWTQYLSVRRRQIYVDVMMITKALFTQIRNTKYALQDASEATSTHNIIHNWDTKYPARLTRTASKQTVQYTLHFEAIPSATLRSNNTKQLQHDQAYFKDINYGYHA